MCRDAKGKSAVFIQSHSHDNVHDLEKRLDALEKQLVNFHISILTRLVTVFSLLLKLLYEIQL